jgi:hypothetical protein
VASGDKGQAYQRGYLLNCRSEGFLTPVNFEPDLSGTFHSLYMLLRFSSILS